MKFRSAYQRDCLALVLTVVILISSFMVPLSVLIQSARSESWVTGWQYRKGITIDHTLVGANSENFPVLIDITDGDLASDAQSDGDDIMFTGNDGLQLSHEIELYSIGHLVAWVKVPNLSSSEDSVLYMYYGNAAAQNQEDPSGVWDSNFVMVQHLSETSGTHYDSTLNGNNGSPVNGVIQGVAGKVDGADDFDGTNDYVTVSHSNTITGFTQAFTASVWIKMDSITGRRTILNKWNTNSQRAWYVDYDSSRGANALGLFVSADGSSYSYWYASFSPAAGNWYNIAVVWQSGQQPLFYVNGAAVTATTSTARASIYNNSLEPLYIGRSYTTGRYFDGVIDEVCISNVARSALWISTGYNNQANPSSFYTVGPEESSGAPIVSNPYPLDGAINVPTSLPLLMFNLTDPNGNLMDYYVTTIPSIGGDYATGNGDGAYGILVSGLAYNTAYTWHVNVTDGVSWTNETYAFTTVSEPLPPVVSDPYPSDGETDVSVSLNGLGVMVSDSNGDLMNITGTTNPDIGFSEGINIPDTPFTIPVSGLAYNTAYTWHVNATDGTFWTNMTYHFTTGAKPQTKSKTLTIDHSLVAGNLVDFPVLIDITDSDLASYAQPDGSDIYFTDINHVQLSHEIEFYGAGHLVAWVTVPNLSSSVNTTLYMRYGDPGAGDPANPAAVWDSNFMMVQHLSETSGTHYDSTSNDNDGTPMNAVSQNAAGMVDGADDFDGTDDYVSVPHSSTITGFSQAFTASFWVKMDSITGRRTFLNKWNTNSQRAWYIDYDSSRGSSALGLFVSADGSAYSYWYASFSPVAGNWYYIAVVWLSGQQPVFYVNGAAVATTTSTARASIYNNSLEPLHIGRSYTTGRYFDGVIDEVRISNVARSAQWIRTCYNNQMNPSAFVTEEEPSPPNVASHVPGSGTTGVAITTTVQVTFSEAMDHAATEGAFSISPSVSGSFSWSSGDTVLTFTPDSALAYETEHTVTISTAAMDMQGEFMLAPYSWSFTTAAYTPPYVVSHDPGMYETGVSLTTNVQVTFSESMDRASAQGAFSISPSVSGSFSWNSGNTTLIFDPSSGLAYNTVYTVTISIAAMDMQGEFMLAPYSWSFTTKLPPPYLVDHVPGVDAMGVLVTTTVQIIFSQPMDRGSTESAFSLDSVSGSFSWSLDNTTMIFTPASPLAYNTLYTATLTTAAMSQSGQYLESSYSWNFTTKQRPTVVGHVPGVDATDVPITTTIQVTFSEPMDRVSTKNAFSISGSVAGSFSWNSGNTTMTFIPTSNLADGTVYTVTITTAAKSMQGDGLVPYSWNFTTIVPTPPFVVSHVPGSGATGVPKTTTVQVTFSEAMDHAATEGAFSISPSVSGSFSWSSGDTVLTFTPSSALAYETPFTVTISTAAMDQQGEFMLAPYSWTFTTEQEPQTGWPYVVNHVPGVDATGVSQYSTIVVTFSEPMDQALTQGAFLISPSVSGRFNWLDTSAMVFEPYYPLKPNSVYTVTITTAAMDMQGENMEALYSWTFTTASSTKPYVTLVVPAPDAQNVSITTPYIRATFSEAMDHASVESSFSISPWVNGTFSWNSASTRITFTPNSGLAYSTVYTVTITTAATDTQDENMAEPYSWTFTTVDYIEFKVVSVVPSNGSTAASINPIITVKFNLPPDDDACLAAFSISPSVLFYSYLENSTAMSFLPAPMAYNTLYTVTITTAARSTGGTNMTLPYTWTFRTVTAPPGPNPYTAAWPNGYHSVGSSLGSGESSPIIADVVTSSPGEEVIYVGGDVGSSSGAVLCLSGIDGHEIWRYTDTAIGWNVQPQMGDIDNDGQYEIIVPTYYPTGIIVLNPSGTLYWKRTGIGGSSYTSKPLVVDPDGDGYWMIFAAPEDVRGYSTTSTYTGRIWAFNYDGREIKNGLQGTAGGTRSVTGGYNGNYFQWFSWRPCSGGFSMADTDNNGLFELYQNDRDMYYGDGDFGKGTIAWEWNATSQSLQLKWYQPDMLVSSHAPILVDVNKDGVLDVVAAYMRGGMAVFDSITGAEIKKDITFGDSSLGLYLPSHYQPTVYDIDRDGNPEILLADGDHSSSPPTIVVFDLYLWKIDARMYVGAPMKFPPTVADVTGDGIMDMVAVSNTGLYIFDGSHDPTVDQTYPVRVVATGMPYQCIYAVVQDIDADGLNEIVFTSSSYRVYAYNTPAPRASPRPRSEVQFYNERRTGVAEYVPPVFYDRTAPIVSGAAPSNKATNVPLSLSHLSFDIRDLQGDLMDYAVTTDFPVDSADLIGINKGVGTYTVDVTGPLQYHKRYTWRVSVTDGIHWNNQTYTFTTLDGTPPGQSPTQSSPLLKSSGTGAYENATSFDLVSTNQTTYDPNGDKVTNIYRWLRNGQSIANLIVPFDTDSLTTAKDYSGYNNNARIYGATWTSNGRVGGAYSFDGLDDYMLIPDGGAGYYNGRIYSSNLGGYGNWNEMTVEMWINLAALSTKDSTRLLMKLPSYEIGLGSITRSGRASNILTAAVWLDNPDSGDNAGPPNSAPKATEYWSVSAPTIPLSINTWYHVAFTYKDGGGTGNSVLTLYINGVAVTTSTSRTTRGPIKASSGEPLYIGWYDYFKGMIDEVRIYSRSLSAEQISQRYSETRDGLTSSSTLSDKEILTGETWTCQVTPNDSHQDGTARSSNSLLILPGPQVPPVASNVQVWGQTSLSNSRVWSNETIIAVYSYSDENDNPEVFSGQYGTQVRWYKNGTYQPALDNLRSLSTSITAAHEDWWFQIKPGDGYGVAAEWMNSTNKVIVNSPPVVTSYSPHYGETQSSITLNVGDSQTFSFTATDYDGDPMTIQWQVNGVTVVENVQSYTWTATELGSFTIRARISDTGYGFTTTTQSWNIVVR